MGDFMVLTRGISGHFRLGMLFCVLLPVTVLHAQPSLRGVFARQGQGFSMSIKGNFLPEFKRLLLTLSYGPVQAQLAQAVVSSPLPGTAFSAMLDTAGKQLVLNIIATSTIKVANGGTVSIIRAQGATGADLAALLIIQDALCIDKDGNNVKPKIEGNAGISFIKTGPLLAAKTSAFFYRSNGRRIHSGGATGAGLRLLPRGRRLMTLKPSLDNSVREQGYR